MSDNQQGDMRAMCLNLIEAIRRLQILPSPANYNFARAAVDKAKEVLNVRQRENP